MCGVNKSAAVGVFEREKKLGTLSGHLCRVRLIGLIRHYPWYKPSGPMPMHYIVNITYIMYTYIYICV